MPKRLLFFSNYKYYILFLLLISFFCCSCSQKNEDSSSQKSASGTHTQTVSAAYVPGQTHILTPKADGSSTCGCDFFTLDFSHAEQGYFIGQLSGQDKKINIQVTGPDGVIYNYFLESPETSAVFPFTAGSGNYLVLTFERIRNDQYAALFSHSLTVNLDNEFLPFLYPNQYVNFSKDCQAAALAAELTADAATDLDALQVLYEYVIQNISYDDQKAATVQNGYLPDIDQTLQSRTGICFDYAALTTAMLRMLSIPARLEIGYSSDVRHAWIDVYIESIGWIENAIEFNGNEWKLMDPTFAAAELEPEVIQDYIGDGDNYVLQYIR